MDRIKCLPVDPEVYIRMATSSGIGAFGSIDWFSLPLSKTVCQVYKDFIFSYLASKSSTSPFHGSSMTMIVLTCGSWKLEENYFKHFWQTLHVHTQRVRKLKKSLGKKKLVK